MRGFINKIFKLLNLSGRDWVVFLLALLLAFSTWIIHKLSQNYSVYLKVEVVAESNLDKRSNYSAAGTEVMARCRTTGWMILYMRLVSDGVAYVRFPATAFQYEGEERYFISSDKLHEYADQIFGPNVSVEYFVTEQVYFKFPEEINKKVPVKAVASLSFDDQYTANSPLVLVPDSVTVYGDKMHLDALDYVTTATIRHSSIKEDFSGMIALTPISGMRLSVDEVHYKMDVTRYLEVTRKSVPVIVEGVPAGKKVIVEPATVNLVMDVEFPLKSDPKKDISVVASYNDVKTSNSGQVMVRLSSQPLGMIRCDITPVAVKIEGVEK